MKKKVLIIGGGVAGLSAGIYSAINGFDTEIIEMHTTAGGQCTACERKNYRFDYCLHWPSFLCWPGLIKKMRVT